MSTSLQEHDESSACVKRVAHFGASPCRSTPTLAVMTLTDTVSHLPSGEWVSTNQALVQLGISERTLFRRLAAGKYRRRTLDDGRIQIWLPSLDRQMTATLTVEASVDDRHVSDID